MPSPDYLALRAAVLAAPGDDLPRLVLADWLDENGDAERAAFIRTQIRLAEVVAGDLAYEDERTFQIAAEVAATPTESLERWLRDDGLPWPPGEALITRDSLGDTESLRSVGDNLRYGVRRGFIESVDCVLQFWMFTGPLIVRCAPVAKVVPHWWEPSPTTGGPRWAWRRPGSDLGTPRNLLPDELFLRLPARRSHTAHYRSRSEAMRALSDACLRFARGEPERPPLE